MLVIVNCMFKHTYSLDVDFTTIKIYQMTFMEIYLSEDNKIGKILFKSSANALKKCSN